MGKTYNFLIAAGVIGGALIVSGINALAFLDSPFNLLGAAILLFAGVLVIYYGRFG